MNQFSQFEEAFCLHVSGCRCECECGRIFWDCGNGWDWEEGETDRLREDKNATALNYSVERIQINGKVYCKDCDCWHEKALAIEEFFREHQEQIGEWFALEKKRLTEAANDVPVIGE